MSEVFIIVCWVVFSVLGLGLLGGLLWALLVPWGWEGAPSELWRGLRPVFRAASAPSRLARRRWGGARRRERELAELRALIAREVRKELDNARLRGWQRTAAQKDALLAAAERAGARAAAEILQQSKKGGAA